LIKGVAAISANDAALGIAEFLTGSEEVFVHEMNEKANALGVKHTHFVNCHGLHAEGQQTSAIDMAYLGFHYIRRFKSCTTYYVLGFAAVGCLLVFAFWRRRIPRKRGK